MDQDQKLAFVSGMTDKALMHMARSPNVAGPDGKMSHEKMMAFVAGLTKQGMQHLDAGGTALGGPNSLSSPPVANPTQAYLNSGNAGLRGVTSQTSNPNTTAGGIGGGVGNVIGTNNQFQAQAAPIQAGTNAAQLTGAYQGAQSALTQQQGVANQLNGGLGEGVGSQEALTNMYLREASGQGPNPAQAALNENTGQNIAQQAALAAGQRGAGANAGLLASQNAQQGAAIQQNAVGQGATMQAQQELAAEQNLQNLAANEIAQGTTATQGINSAQQNEQNILQGANNALNAETVGQQSNLNTVNANIATGNQTSAGNAISGIGSAIGAALPVIAAAVYKGGTIKKMATGGIAGEPTSGPQSYVGQWLNSNTNNPNAQIQNPSLAQGSGNSGVGGFANGIQSGLKAMPAQPQGQLTNADVQEIADQAPSESTGNSDLSQMGSSQFASRGGLIKMDKGGNVLDANARSRIAPHNFALPGGRYPIHDENHARNALARVSQNGTPDEKAKVRAAVAKKYPGIGVKKMDAGGTASNAPAPEPQAPLSYNGAGPNERQQRAEAAQRGFDKAAQDNPVSRGIAWVKNNMACGGMLAADGGKVAAGPGEGAVKPGDSLKNDKVPAMLSQGEIVIPRHITMSPNAPAMAAQFVANELKKRARK